MVRSLLVANLFRYLELRFGEQVTSKFVDSSSLWLLYTVFGGVLFAQPTLRITSPPDGTVVNPGGSVKVTVEASPANALKSVGVMGRDPIGVSQAASEAPYEVTVLIPRRIRPGIYDITAFGLPLPGQGKPGGDADHSKGVLSAPISLIVERSDDPVRLEVFPTSIRIRVGGKAFLSVTGVFADGER